MDIIALLLIIVTAILSLLHFYWLLGGKLAFKNSVPEKEGEMLFKPGKMATLFVAIALLFVSFFSLHLLKHNIYLNFEAYHYLIFGFFFAFIFLVRAIGDLKYLGFFKKIKHTKFAVLDSKLYSPICLFLSISLILLTSKYL